MTDVCDDGSDDLCVLHHLEINGVDVGYYHELTVGGTQSYEARFASLFVKHAVCEYGRFGVLGKRGGERVRRESWSVVMSSLEKFNERAAGGGGGSKQASICFAVHVEARAQIRGGANDCLREAAVCSARRGYSIPLRSLSTHD